jgi:hypothetical protein
MADAIAEVMAGLPVVVYLTVVTALALAAIGSTALAW